MAANATARVYRVDVVAPDNVPLSLSLPQDVPPERRRRRRERRGCCSRSLLSRLDAHLDTHKDAESGALEPLARGDAADDRARLIHVNKSASSDA